MMAFTSAVEPLRSANRMSGRELYRWEVYTIDGGPVTASDVAQSVREVIAKL